MKTEILKSLYSAKHGCNLVLKRAKSSSSSVLSLVKSESGVETPVLKKSYDSLPNGNSLITRFSMDGDEFRPSTTIILENNRIRDFLIHKSNGDSICGSMANGKVHSTEVDEMAMVTGSGITKDGTTPMAKRFLNLIENLLPNINKH